MPTRDSFDPNDPLPRFLADRPEEEIGLDIGNLRDGGVTTSRAFKAGILMTAVIATAIAVVAIADPGALFTHVTAALVGNPSPLRGNVPSPPIVQSAADAPALVQSNADAKANATADPQALPQTLPPTATDAPASYQIAAAEPVAKNSTDKNPTEAVDPSSEALFRQFQAWLSQQDAPAKAEPVLDAPAPIMQEAPAPAVEDVRGARPLTQKRRHAAAVHDAQAEPRAQNLRKPVPRAQDPRAARPPVQPVQDARAQEPTSGPNAPAPSFLPSIFGQRN